MRDYICGYRYCDNEFKYPKTKYCTPECSSRERVLVISDKGKLNPNPKYIEAQYAPKETKEQPTDPEIWSRIGANSSMEAMEEVAQLFNKR